MEVSAYLNQPGIFISPRRIPADSENQLSNGFDNNAATMSKESSQLPLNDSHSNASISPETISRWRGAKLDRVDVHRPARSSAGKRGTGGSSWGAAAPRAGLHRQIRVPRRRGRICHIRGGQSELAASPRVRSRARRAGVARGRRISIPRIDGRCLSSCSSRSDRIARGLLRHRRAELQDAARLPFGGPVGPLRAPLFPRPARYRT